MKTIKIVLVGQPNVGKSMLLNSVSNANLRVGNFAGVTVEKAQINFEKSGYKFEITDLPGTYALNDYTLEEKVTKEELLKKEYDLILNVVDSTNLERNLLLTTELMELDSKMVIALNMSDEAKSEGIEINQKQLSDILGVPSVGVSALTKVGIDELFDACISVANSNKTLTKIAYSEPMEEEIANIVTLLGQRAYKHNKMSRREVAIALLKQDKTIYNEVKLEPLWMDLEGIVRAAFEHLSLHFDTKNMVEVFQEERLSYARGACAEVIQKNTQSKKSITEKIDNILIHKVFGLPIFLFFMWALFQLTFEIGAIPMDWIDAFFGFLGDKTHELLGETQLASLIADGILAGVGAVIMFLPNIIILFLGIALLETTGYMSRVAFLLDGFFHRFGLHGKSFIPLVTGFGCSVPAYMAARTLKNDQDRLLTLFIIGFMSCGARLPVYVLFVGAFFGEENAGNILFAIYIFGALLGLIAAKVLKRIAFDGKNEPFVMEMPKYRLPSVKLVWHVVVSKAMMYVKKAGTFILAASILVWFASSYPHNEELEEKYMTMIEATEDEEKISELEFALESAMLEQSYLGRIGKSTEFLFAPLGFDWKLTVALETGLAAKEVIVSTIGVLYSLGGEVDEESEGLMDVLRANIPLPAAMSFLAFVMIYLPCLAATVVFTKEAGSYKYLGYLILFTTATAWIFSFIVYRIALLVV